MFETYKQNHLSKKLEKDFRRVMTLQEVLNRFARSAELVCDPKVEKEVLHKIETKDRAQIYDAKNIECYECGSNCAMYDMFGDIVLIGDKLTTKKAKEKQVGRLRKGFKGYLSKPSRVYRVYKEQGERIAQKTNLTVLPAGAYAYVISYRNERAYITRT